MLCGEGLRGLQGDRTVSSPARQGKSGRPTEERWIAACKAEKPELPWQTSRYAGMLTEAILLGNVAIQAGRR